MSIPESSITAFLELANDLGVRGLDTGNSTSQKTDQLDADSMVKPGDDSMTNLDTGYKTLGKSANDHVTESEKGEPSYQCDEANEKGEIFNKPAMGLNNKKPWIQANHFLRNLTGWATIVKFQQSCRISVKCVQD